MTLNLLHEQRSQNIKQSSIMLTNHAMAIKLLLKILTVRAMVLPSPNN